jgi:hypothetical protein
MEKMEFALRGEVFYVQSVMDRQGCDALARHPQVRCVVDPAVSSEVFRVLLSAIEGNAVEATNGNADDLSALGGDFEFWSLLERVRAFKETPTYRIGRQNARMEALEQRFQEPSPHFQTQEASLEAAVVRLSQAEVNVTRSAADVQSWRQSAATAQNGLEREMKTVPTSVGALDCAAPRWTANVRAEDNR